MKKSFPGAAKLLWLLYLTGFAGAAGTETFLLLERHMKTIPGAMAHWVASFLPHTIAAQTILHILWLLLLLICFPLLLIPFSYKVLKEWIYVDRMYVLRDLVEAKKLKPADLTPEQHHFIFIHWPDLFKP